jgi:hypothetical protein
LFGGWHRLGGTDWVAQIGWHRLGGTEFVAQNLSG